MRQIYLFLAVSSFLVGYLLWLTQIAGLGGTPDTANYLAAAESFANQGNLYITQGRPLLWWPPLYPVCWGLLIKLGLPAFHAALVLNLAAFVFFAWGSFRLCQEQLSHHRLATVCWILSIATYSNIRVFAQALSEAGFLALTVWVFVWFFRSQSAQNKRFFLVAGCLAGLACLWRYQGISWVCSLALSLLWVKQPLLFRLRRLGLWLGLSAVPLCLWLLRNWFISKTLTGKRPPAAQGFMANLSDTLQASINWIVMDESKSGWLFVPLIISAFAFALLLFGSAMNQPNKPRSLHAKKTLVALILSIGIYLILFLLLSSVSYTSKPSSRFIAPIIPLVIVLIGQFWELFQFHKRPHYPLLTACALLPLFLLIGLGLLVRGSSERLTGWNARTLTWQQSPIIDFVRQLPAEVDILSNMRQEIYLHTQRHTKGMPFNTHQLDAYFEDAIQNKPTYLVWSDLPAKQRKSYTWEELAAVLDTSSAIRHKDGWSVLLNH